MKDVVLFTGYVYGAVSGTNVVVTTNLSYTISVAYYGTVNDLAVYASGGTLYEPAVMGLYPRNTNYWCGGQLVTAYGPNGLGNRMIYHKAPSAYVELYSPTSLRYGQAIVLSDDAVIPQSHFFGLYAASHSEPPGYGLPFVTSGPYTVTTTNWTTNIVSVTNYTYADTQYVVWAIGADADDAYVTKNATNRYSLTSPAQSNDSATFPVFRLDVGNVDGNWTDFEIKASTNNFAGMVYYYKSWTTQDATNPDTNAYVYFTDDYAADVRVWYSKSNDIPVSSHLTSTNSVVGYVYFMPSHDMTNIPWAGWMAMTNTRLVWSWVRVDDIGFEMNAGDTKQRWNPIRPDSWEVQRTAP